MELCKKVLEIQEKAWKQRIQPEKEKEDDATILRNVVDYMKTFYPHATEDEIQEHTKCVIAFKRREKECDEKAVHDVVKSRYHSSRAFQPPWPIVYSQLKYWSHHNKVTWEEPGNCRFEEGNLSRNWS